jgi:hypothetical protein
MEAVRRILEQGVLAEKAAKHMPKIEATDFDSELAKVEKEIETWCRAEERAAKFLVAPEHADRQRLFEDELNRATERRKRAEERKASLDLAKAADVIQRAKSASVQSTCKILLARLSRLTREQWREVLLLLLDEVTATGGKMELRGILPAGDVGANAVRFRSHCQ